jgi:hypothetical protein
MGRGISDATRIKQGRGLGSKDTWIPWVLVHDFGGRGRKHHIPSQVFNQPRHALSQIEANLIYCVEMSENIADSREQYPLDLSETKLIASQLGIKHPISPDRNREVMSTDMLIDYKDHTQRAIAIKSSADLIDRRIIEKLQIEKMYWESKGVKWSLMTEREFPGNLIYNLKLLRSFFQIKDELNDVFHDKLKQFRSKDHILSDAIKLVSREIKIPPGRGLEIFKHLCSRKLIKFDYYRVFSTKMHLHEFIFPLTP